MADTIKDAEDRMLETLFRADPIADNGFSQRVVARVRRRLWLRRVTLPLAAAVGAAISLKPLGMLVRMLYDLVTLLPDDIVAQSTGWIPPLPMIMLGVMLLVAMLLGLRIIEE